MKLSGLGVWNLYFLVKFALYYYGAIDFNVLTNAALAAMLAIEFKKPLIEKAKHLLGGVLAVVLLYQDSWLPPINRLTKQAGNVQDFSFGYFIELITRVINVDMILALFVICICFWYTSQWIRFTTVTVVGLLVMGWQSGDSQSHLVSNTPNSAAVAQTQSSTQTQVITEAIQSPDQKLADFYQQQSLLTSNFPSQVSGELFDVIILNVCSMAVADLKAIGVDITDMYDDFDVVFSDFNSATSYSGPAAIRLLRASCGQTSQTALFKDAPEQCYLFKNLEKLGYQNNVVMNHDGHFDEFKGLINKYGGLNSTPFNIDSMPVAQYGFDDSPIYSDGAVLNGWLDTQAKDCKPCAMYYNTTSLHDGNQLANRARMNSQQSYPIRHKNLFSDINTFVKNLESRGRNVMLMIVPEHGAALKGDKVQFAGLREIPSPSIVSVPVAIKFIGPDVQNYSQIVVDDSTSYFALSQLVSKALQTDVFGGKNSVANLLENLPKAPKVAENADTIMMYVNQRPYIQLDGGDWTAYPQGN
ncbi:cellulose biosynthesis protein BcsG [Pseudoalteromonas sp. S3178]|uniref:cellulose biosynthesis protein BcsG n=1 Tax=Pseudoalteromonas sp. S3178 TaxID=579532 RepID=UPI00110C0637|nr:cellulose biosynthesis protein BcsG [Pseudoalteromonas sp. S3178]TMP06616.1 cellulose biosynthesis protein BcsG [Pseudoalteromonas sp. S3178]